MLYRYFKIDEEGFTVLVLNADGHVKLRTVKPVNFDAILKALLP